MSGCKRQTSNGTSQTSSYLSTKSFNINRQVSVVKQGVSIRSFRYFEYILYVIYFTVNDCIFIANRVSGVSRLPFAVNDNLKVSIQYQFTSIMIILFHRLYMFVLTSCIKDTRANNIRRPLTFCCLIEKVWSVRGWCHLDHFEDEMFL